MCSGHKLCICKFPISLCACAGGLAIGVPGELRGLELAHQKFGKLSWDTVFQPAAQIADEGFAVSPALATVIEEVKGRIINGSFNTLK